ncbi:hypothetical protein CRUP_029748, partial [Coryphaenoides rupestris]
MGGGASHQVEVKAPWAFSSDGRQHSLIVSRTRKVLLVQLDEDHVESTPLSSGEASTLPPSDVFIETPTFLTSGTQFGSRNSHMTFQIHPTAVRKSFVLQLSLRTRASSGLVFLLSSSNHKDYASLEVRGGRLLFTLDLGRGPASCSSAHPVSDGQWHTVRTEFVKRWVSMVIDGVTSHPVSVKGN